MAFAPAIIAIGTLASTVGTVMSGMAQAQAANYNAAIQERNARAAIDQASAARGQEVRASQQRLGRIRASYGASGMTVAGSALDVFEDQAIEDKLAQNIITYQGKIRATGHKDQANLDRMGARSARTAAIIGGVSAAASGIGKALTL